MPLRTIAETSELLRLREVSPVELVRECLKRIEELNPKLNAFITVTADSALDAARQAETEVRSGNWRGPLHGIPIGLKDLIDTAGVRTTAASAIFQGRVPTGDAAVVTRLKTAGAIVIGKQNLHEFAYGGSSVISDCGPVRNPINPDYIAGGSSGGSVAAVVSGMCYASVGTDTAGSVREPAALCGAVGFKPSYGLVSTAGIIPLSPSLDHAGPITITVEDTAIMLDALTGSEKYRSTLPDARSNVRLGIPRQYFFEKLNPDVAVATEEAIADLRSMGCIIADIEIPVENDRTLQAAEAYSFHRDRVRSTPHLFHPETLRRIRTGENITVEQHDSALRELAHQREEISAIFKSVDLLLTPTTPVPAPRIASLTSDLDMLRPAELLLLRNTRPVNVWGLPAISVPCGATPEGLPIGLQIIGPPRQDKKVLQLAFAFEQLEKHSRPS